MKQKDLTALYQAILDGDTETMGELLSLELQETISFYDYAENYYHGFLAGLLKNIEGYRIKSNRESGLGRPDIILKTPSVRGMAIILELKVSPTFLDMEEKCREALSQIETQRYEESLRQEGYSKIIKYGVCFYRKECLVMMK